MQNCRASGCPWSSATKIFMQHSGKSQWRFGPSFSFYLFSQRDNPCNREPPRETLLPLHVLLSVLSGPDHYRHHHKDIPFHSRRSPFAENGCSPLVVFFCRCSIAARYNSSADRGAGIKRRIATSSAADKEPSLYVFLSHMLITHRMKTPV